VDYGGSVLSHPLVVDAAETLFIPVCVYNNVEGRDKKTLDSFGEPAWNNPVVRIVSADRSLLAPRVNGDYTLQGLVQAMMTALDRRGDKAPPYLQLLAEELAQPREKLEKATFAMHCFWQGELDLGAIPGVVGTLPGFVRNEEVVDVWFDPLRVGYGALLKTALGLDCASTVYARSDAQLQIARKAVGDKAVRSDEKTRPDKEPKYYLYRSDLRHLPMTELQAIRVNRALHRNGDPLLFLSPGQQRLLTAIRKRPEAGWNIAVGKDFASSFLEAEALASKVVSGS
jgi:hypothetical protein